jgi:hypothetical protein
LSGGTTAIGLLAYFRVRRLFGGSTGTGNAVGSLTGVIVVSPPVNRPTCLAAHSPALSRVYFSRPGAKSEDI